MGKIVVTGLANSTNLFRFKPSSENPKGDHSEFVDDNMEGPFGLAMLGDPNQVVGMLGGSGGVIYFSTMGQGVASINNEEIKGPISEIAHEMFHAYEGNYGLTNNAQYTGTILSATEYRAAYFEI